MSEFDTELVLEFKAEAEEHLATVEPSLLSLEQTPPEHRAELVNSVFRALHSVKGVAGFFGLDRIQELAHALETLLMKVRDGKLEFRSEFIDPLLAGVDKLSALIAPLPEIAVLEIEDEVASVRALAEGEVPAAPSAPAAPPGATPAPAPATNASPDLVAGEEALAESRRFGQKLLRFDVSPDRIAGDAGAATLLAAIAELGGLVAHAPLAGGGLAVLARSVLAPALYAGELGIPESSIRLQSAPSPAAAPSASAAPSAAPAPPTARAPSDEAKAPAPDPAHPTQSSGNESVRVNVQLLDRLMTLAGELVLSRNQLLRSLSAGNGQPNPAVLRDLDSITSELQGEIMRTRLQPIGIAFGKFNRVVRDLSKKLGKEVRLETSGDDVELDRSIVELLSDPLTHLVRNALDHGLESPADREAAGKPRVGALWLSAKHEGGQVHIEIRDDGRGIDAAAVRRVAAERGVLTREQAEALSERDAQLLIFAPGFSTAKQVTDVSGRGVGMDVVKTNISKLGGEIDVESKVGVGTSLRIRLPLTLAIVPCLIVSACEERFAIPQVNLVELVRLAGRELSSRLTHVSGAPLLRLRGRLLPLVNLGAVLKGAPPQQLSPDTASLAIAVLSFGETRFGLVVDSVRDTEEVVVKPLSRWLEASGLYAGATIMGDGRVAMILDAAGIAEAADLRLDDANALEHEEKSARSVGDRRQLVLFDNAGGEQFAIDLGRLARLERVPRAEIEVVGGREWMQYRGEGLPLVRLTSVLPVGEIDGDSPDLFVLIPRGAARSGLLAGRILDTIETELALQRESDDPPAVFGRAIVNGRLTLVLDPDVLMQREIAA